GLVGGGAGAQHHEGHGLGALDVVFNGNHAGLLHGGVAFEHALDFGGVDVLSTRDEHIVAPPPEGVKAVGIAVEYIAGAVVAVGREGRTQVRALVIALHQAGAFELQHAGVGRILRALAQPHLHGGVRIAYRGGGSGPPVRVRAEHHRSAFGGAVGIDDAGVGQHVVYLLPQAGADRDRKSTRLNSSHVKI